MYNFVIQYIHRARDCPIKERNEVNEMKRNVRGGIIKHYCDKCGKNIYDYIPKKEQSGIQVKISARLLRSIFMPAASI